MREGEQTMEATSAKILITQNVMLPDEALAELEGFGPVVRLADNTEATLFAQIQGAGTIIVGARPYVSRELIEAAETLKHIARPGVGLDNIDLPAATGRGVFVTNVPEVTSDSVAEFTMALLLGLAKNIARCDRAVKSGNWKERANLQRDHIELSGKTHGIVGLGRIGRKVALRCKAFGMKVIYYQRTRDREFEQSHQVEYAPFETLLAASDSISLHLPLSEDTINLFDRQQLVRMKPTALLVNQSRGRVVNEDALVAVLREERIGGYATDVYAQEPPSADWELLKFKNVLATPHLGGSTRESRDRAARLLLEDVALVRQGLRPLRLANPAVPD